jgi:N-acyl amino acid synthase of PEP-CTERM/exosortase system
MQQTIAKPGISSLFTEFARYFELSLALTEAQKEDVYRVRYSVYCEEFGYEKAEAFRNGMETDAFDAQSVHCLVRHIETGLPAGCVRLVSVADDQHLPMEDHCGDALDRAFFDGFANRRDSMSEISRLAVDSHFRRRRGENLSRFGNPETLQFAAREKRTFPLIAVGLFLAAAAVSDIQRRPNLFAIMEPFLPAILRRTGVVVQRVGEDFDFKGLRAPYYLNFDEAERVAQDELRRCYEVVREQFASVLVPAGQRAVSRLGQADLGVSRLLESRLQVSR